MKLSDLFGKKNQIASATLFRGNWHMDRDGDLMLPIVSKDMTSDGQITYSSKTLVLPNLDAFLGPRGFADATIEKAKRQSGNSEDVLAGYIMNETRLLDGTTAQQAADHLKKRNAELSAEAKVISDKDARHMGLKSWMHDDDAHGKLLQRIDKGDQVAKITQSLPGNSPQFQADMRNAG